MPIKQLLATVFATMVVVAGISAAHAQTAHSQLAASAHLTEGQAGSMTLDDIADAKRLSDGNANH